MIGYAYNRKTGKVDMAGEYSMVKAFTDSSCYDVLTADELEELITNE